MPIELVPAHKLGDVMLATEIKTVLDKYYPGYPWAVWVNDERLGGEVCITNWMASQKKGYYLHLDTVYKDVDRKRVVRAGGEFLEAAGMPHRLQDQREGIDPNITGWDDKEYI